MAGEQDGVGHPDDGANRRKMERIGTDRVVRFSNTKFTGPLHEGIATDMSPGGLRIEIHHPEGPGTEIEIELPPKPGDRDAELIYFTGRVMHVTQLDAGASAMGIQLAQGSNIGDPIRGGAKGLESKEDAGPGSALRAGLAQAISAEPHKHGTAEAPANRSRLLGSDRAGREHGSRLRRLVPRFGLLLLVILAAIWHFTQDTQKGNQGSRTAAFEFSPRSIEQEAKAPELPPPESGVVGPSPLAQSMEPLLLVAEPLDGQFASPAEFLGRAQAALIAGRLNEAAELFSRLESHPRITPMQRFLSLLGHAESARAPGDRGLAAMLVHKAQGLGDGGVPGAWMAAAEELESSLSASGSTRSSPPAFSELVNLVPVAGDQKDGTVAVPPLRVEVDTGRYLLHIIENGSVVKSFPVGLGCNGTTPLGDFEIANKITDPALYNRGEVVPTGDPRNPLGKRWMGLGEDGKATSYGIHPTSEPESIRKNASQSCVRMRPSDAEEVFQRCPIGTPVRIHS